MRFILVAVACLVLPCTAYSQGLLDRVKKGVSNAGETIENTADNVGNAVNDTISSTTEMVTNEETPELTRQRIDGVATEALSVLFSVNPEAKALYEQSYGYAVFDARQLTVAGATAGYGRGVAIEKVTNTRTYMKMGTGGVGFSFGLGGFDQKIVVLFEDGTVFHHFIDNGYDATAQAGTMFGDEKESQEVQFIDGWSIFVLTEKGWKVSASAAGTKYWRDADLN